MKFRSPFNLGDYQDFTVCSSPDLVDTTGYEPLSDIIARMLRGEVKPSCVGEYDFEDEKTESFEDFSQIEDISEAYNIGAEMAQNLRKKASQPKETVKSSEVVKNENSENLKGKKSGSDAEASVSATGSAS